MGLFDFFKSKDKAADKNKLKLTVEPNALGEFNLTSSDFDIKKISAKVISVKLDPEFHKLFPEAGEPGKPGKKLELNTYTASIILWGQTVEVSVDSKIFSGSFDDFIIKINKQLSWLVKNVDVVNEGIIGNLLPLKNGEWSDEDSLPIKGEEFIKSIQLASIDITKNAGLSLYYNDGDLFGGHEIEVKINSKGVVKGSTIVG